MLKIRLSRHRTVARSFSTRSILFSDVVPKDEKAKPVDNKASPPPLTLPENRLQSQKGQFVPRATNKRLIYDNSPPPKPTPWKSFPSNSWYTWRKIAPVAFALGAGIWFLYTYDYLSTKEEDTVVLSPNLFTKWIVTYKYEIPDCPDHFIVELTKKNYHHLKSSFNPAQNSLWNGHRLWSVEVCQPEINIVRSYTPLPLYVASIDTETKAPYLKVIDHPDEESKFILYVKKYDQGEMGRWLSRRPLFSEVLLRGPIDDYTLPYSPVDELTPRESLKSVPSRIAPESSVKGGVKPDNLAFYVAGTGVTPALQMLYSKNPPKGFVEVHWSLKDRKEIPKTFSDLNFILEKLGRAQFHYYIENEKRLIISSDIKPPAERNYQGFRSLDFIKNKENHEKISAISNDPSITDSEKQLAISRLNQHPNDSLYTPLSYRTQLEQFAAIKDKLTVKDPALAIVCGPDGYMRYICGAKDLNNAENVDTAPVSGLLSAKNWDKSNVVRL